MIIETGQSYWDFRQKYSSLAPTAKKLVLGGEALLLLRDTKSEAVKRRLQAFIAFECARMGVVDKTASFV